MLALLFSFCMLAVITAGWVDAITAQDFTGVESNVNIMLAFEIVEFKDIFGKTLIPTINFDWFVSAWNVFTWNYWFFGGVNQHVRLFTALIITSAAFWGIKTTLGPIILQAVSTLLQGVRAGISIFRGG